MKISQQKGDTIVEVMIAIIIVSAVLGGAFASASRSLNGTRESQERGEALKYVEAQLEQVKNDAQDKTNPVNSLVSFCITSTGTVSSLPAGTPNTDLNSDDFSAYSSKGCNFGTVPGGYHLSVVRTNNDYVARARWDGADGKNKQEVRIIYRVMDPTISLNGGVSG